MKKFIAVITIALCTLNTTHAQWGSWKKIKGNGVMVTKTRSLSDYDQIKVKGPLDVNLVSGKEGALVINTESNFMEYIETEVSNGKLNIYIKKGYNLRPTRGKKIKITVPFKDISAVTLSGSGDIKNTDVIRAENFKTAVSGSGDIKLNIEANHLKTAVSGSGDVVLKGNTNTLDCKVSGSGDIEAFSLNAKTVTAAVAGSGDVEVTATEEITAKVSGSGGIVYAGNPEKVGKSKAGSGSISPR